MKSGNNQEPRHRTRGAQYIWNYLEDFVKSELFQSFVREIRIEYSIATASPTNEPKTPYEDFKLTSEQKDLINILTALRAKIKPKMERYNSRIEDTLIYYIFSNKLNPTFLQESVGESIEEINLCRLFDLSKMVKTIPKEQIADFIIKIAEEYPFAVLSTPAASTSVIIDYLRENQPYLNTLIKKYSKGGKLGRQNKKNADKEKRNDIIYKNRSLSSKKIKETLEMEGFTGMTYPEINKIRNDEIKKRNS